MDVENGATLIKKLRVHVTRSPIGALRDVRHGGRPVLTRLAIALTQIVMLQ